MGPNPSRKPFSTGRLPGPVWLYAVHLCQPGPCALPSPPDELDRQAPHNTRFDSGPQHDSWFDLEVFVKKADEFVAHLKEVFRLFGPVRSRRMFGGFGIYHNDLMIGLVADDTLYLKTDALSVPRFAEAGCQPFEYTRNGLIMKMSYSSAPVEIFDDPEAARTWATRAYDAALRSRSKASKRPK